MSRDSNDRVVVVGAGLGGLSAAAYLAHFGLEVVVLERLDGPGGYAHAFRRGEYVLDPAIHAITGAEDGGTVDLLLSYLGVRDQCTFVAHPSLYRVLVGDEPFEAPVGLEALIEAHALACPADSAGLRDFFTLCDQFVAEAHQVPVQLRLRELDQAVEQFPTLFRYRTSTLAQVVGEFVSGERARALCAAIWPLLGLPPSRLAFELFARFLITQAAGTYHCVGGFQRLADAFVTALERAGGRLITGTEVTSIVMRDGRPAGVVCADGTEIEASIVVSNADARQTLQRLVGTEHLPRGYVRRLERLRPSISAFVVYAATSLPLDELDLAHETFVYETDDYDTAFEGLLRGEPFGTQISIPSLHDRTLAPEGEHVVVSTTLAPYDLGRPWDEVKAPLQDAYLGLVERVVPGFRERLTFVESATPKALERYTLNFQGAVYGWENAPDQSASRRLTSQTPIPGLFLVGHWAQPGSALRVIVTGAQAAQLILQQRGVDDVGPTF